MLDKATIYGIICDNCGYNSSTDAPEYLFSEEEAWKEAIEQGFVRKAEDIAFCPYCKDKFNHPHSEVKTMNNQIKFYENDLSELALNQYKNCDIIAVDTETRGLNPKRDRLCLVQVCNLQGEVSLVRIEQGQRTAPCLQQLLESSALTKVFHYARFDLAFLQQLGIVITKDIFCTKIASKLARTYSGNHGLKTVVKEMLGIDLNKDSQCSDWGNPLSLSENQIAYAAEDVRHLIPLKYKLKEMLQRENQWHLAQDCFDCLPTIVDLDLKQYENIFDH